MIYGILSDTHEDRMNALPHIIAEFKKRGVQKIIHCGDIEPKHLKAELFGGLPVVCALIKEQIDRPEFQSAPDGWSFTRPNDRIHRLNEFYSAYIGHATSFEFLTGSEAKLEQKLREIRTQHDGVRYFFSGHTHHQIYEQSHLVSFINPGAVEDSFEGGYEFAIVNTDNGEIVFCRIPPTNPTKPTFSVGIISDSFNIAEMDPDFWKLLAEEFRKRGVLDIIHCGNIAISDIGRPEFEGFKVHYNLRADQKYEQQDHKNWIQVTAENPVVDINGYKFCIQLDLGADLLEMSEFNMHKLCLGLRKKYPEIRFILCGLTSHAFYEEGAEMRIMNPGGVLNDRNFAVVCLPRTEITFSHVPVSPLPSIK